MAIQEFTQGNVDTAISDMIPLLLVSLIYGELGPKITITVALMCGDLKQLWLRLYLCLTSFRRSLWYDLLFSHCLDKRAEMTFYFGCQMPRNKCGS